MEKYIIAPSILAADFANLGNEVLSVLNAGADWIHFDVMDNHYVPNLTVGPLVCKAIRPYVKNALIDVHLMVSPVDALITQFAEAGADIIVFHVEASTHIDRSIELIKSYGLKVGVALNPATPISYLDYILHKIDMVLLMSVNPGFGGQSFIPGILNKISQVRGLINKTNPNIILQVDGGVNIDNIASIASSGANAFVAGSAIFKAPDYTAAIKNMRKQLFVV
ncbi:MAG: ribulose-phosphate 3-epimerase [Proteobacteria bacterium]|jgi:ribulose-phosphate 3-epimerase|nr:ribulose-phosphate 3-epimerase [Pseudomonadota bacterium]